MTPRRGSKKPSTCWFTPQMAAMARVSQMEARSLKPHLQGPKQLSHILPPSKDHLQGTAWEAEL